MNEKPILFSSEMVRAILEGRKTQTRRVIKPRGVSDDVAQWLHTLAKGVDMKCPYGKPGDQLWVRETWDFRYWGEPGNPFRVMVSYGADGFQKLCESPHDWNPTLYGSPRLRPSIHMPRWASRIQLEIASIRAERVQEITRSDAKAEGVSNVWSWDEKRNAEHPEHFRRALLNPYIANYSVLWDQINAGRGFGWDVNPWVWVVEFKTLAPSALSGTSPILDEHQNGGGKEGV